MSLNTILLLIAREGGVEEAIRRHDYLGKGIYTFNGNLTNEVLGNMFDIPCVNLDLIIPGR